MNEETTHNYPKDWSEDAMNHEEIGEFVEDRIIKNAMEKVVRPLIMASSYPEEKRLDRDILGKVVRNAWIEWARTQDNPKSSWLVSYEELDEPDKEADRVIGEHVLWYVKAVVKLNHVDTP